MWSKQIELLEEMLRLDYIVINKDDNEQIISLGTYNYKPVAFRPCGKMYELYVLDIESLDCYRKVHINWNGDEWTNDNIEFLQEMFSIDKDYIVFNKKKRKRAKRVAMVYGELFAFNYSHKVPSSYSLLATKVSDWIIYKKITPQWPKV